MYAGGESDTRENNYELSEKKLRGGGRKISISLNAYFLSAVKNLVSRY